MHRLYNNWKCIENKSYSSPLMLPQKGCIPFAEGVLHYVTESVVSVDQIEDQKRTALEDMTQAVDQCRRLFPKISEKQYLKVMTVFLKIVPKVKYKVIQILLIV